MKRIVVLCVCLISSVVYAGRAKLYEVETHQNATQTRITLVLSGVPQYSGFDLSNPSRFVLDLKNVNAAHALHLSVPAHSVLTEMRYATHPDGVFRMVFNLKQSIRPKIQLLRSRKTDDAKLELYFQDSALAQASIPKVTLAPPMAENDVISATPNHFRNVIVVIDPGHGGKDPGAIGLHGAKEKNIVLAISLKLEKIINQMPGFRAYVTRSTDTFLTLRDRLRVAREDHADMFIAIHADKYRNVTASGVSVFALSQRGATSEAARWLAHRENASELMGGVKLDDQSHLLKSVLINLSQSATIRSSLLIGKDIMWSLAPIARLHYHKVEQAAFVVLKSPDIPSLLVETGFLSNPLEEKKLTSSNYQQMLAQSIAKGLQKYFVYNPPRDTWLAYWKDNPNTRRV